MTSDQRRLSGSNGVMKSLEFRRADLGETGRKERRRIADRQAELDVVAGKQVVQPAHLVADIGIDRAVVQRLLDAADEGAVRQDDPLRVVLGQHRIEQQFLDFGRRRLTLQHPEGFPDHRAKPAGMHHDNAFLGQGGAVPQKTGKYLAFIRAMRTDVKNDLHRVPNSATGACLGRKYTGFYGQGNRFPIRPGAR